MSKYAAAILEIAIKLDIIHDAYINKVATAQFNGAKLSEAK